MRVPAALMMTSACSKAVVKPPNFKPPQFKPLMFAAALSSAMLAGGCGMGGIDGVELNGGVFDALGLSGSGEKTSKETKVAARPGLVLPPDQTRLPPPEAGPPKIAQAESWPVEESDKKAGAKAALAKQQADYCETALRNARLRNESGVVMGPAGNCQPGMFGDLLGNSGKAQ